MGRAAAGAAIALAWVLLAATLPVQGAIHRCKDADGTRSYSDRGCERRVVAPKRASPKAVPGEPAVTALAPAVPATAPPAAPQPEATAATPGGSGMVDDTERAVVAPQWHRRAVNTVQWPLFFGGMGLVLLAWLLQIIVAFRSGAIAWGMALTLLSPLSSLLYLLLRPRQAWFGALLMAGGTAMMAVAYVPSVRLMDVRDSYITARGTPRIDDRRPREQLRAGEIVYLKTVVDWNDWSVGGNHDVNWQWLTGEQLRSAHHAKMRFGQPPRVLLGTMPAADLGIGRHRVQLYVDGELFDERSFEVVP